MDSQGAPDGGSSPVSNNVTVPQSQPLALPTDGQASNNPVKPDSHKIAEGLEINDKGKGNDRDTDEEGEQLECAICLQSCIHPVKLPCTHIFCFLCVKGIANQSKKCALCRQVIPPDFLKRPKLLRLNDLLIEKSLKDGHQWFYEGNNGWWQYDERTSCELEDKHNEKATNFELLIAGFLYVIDLTHMIQYRRNDPTRRRRIKRDVCTAPKKGVAGLSIYKPKSSRKAADGGESDDSSRQNVNSTTRQNANTSRQNINASQLNVTAVNSSPAQSAVATTGTAVAANNGGAVQRRQKVNPIQPQSQSSSQATDSQRNSASPLRNTPSPLRNLCAQLPRHSMVTRSAKNRSNGRQLPPPPPPPMYVQSYPPYMPDGTSSSVNTVNVQPPSSLPQQTISVNNQQCIAVMPQSSSTSAPRDSPSGATNSQGSAPTRRTRSRLSNNDHRNNNTLVDRTVGQSSPNSTQNLPPTLDAVSVHPDSVSPVTDQLENLSLQSRLSPRVHLSSSARGRIPRRRQPRARPRGQIDDDDIDSPDSDNEW